MKPLLALLAAPLLAAPSASTTALPYSHDAEAIVRVDCSGGWGSAVKVGVSTYITAAHVIDAGGCTVGGVGITLTAVDRWNDYATFIGPSSNHVIEPSCDGFSSGKMYVARGYAAGFNENVLVPWLATEIVWRAQRLFLADAAIPGMSGGPVIDRKGRVVGIVTMRVASRSLPLDATGVCA